MPYDNNELQPRPGDMTGQQPEGTNEASRQVENHSKCATCDHFEPDGEAEATSGGGTGYGRCLLLSFVDVEDEPDSPGSEMTFYCHNDWYCKSHSDNDEDEETPPARQQPRGRREGGATGTPGGDGIGRPRSPMDLLDE